MEKLDQKKREHYDWRGVSMLGIFLTTRNLFCAAKGRGRVLGHARANRRRPFFSQYANANRLFNVILLSLLPARSLAHSLIGLLCPVGTAGDARSKKPRKSRRARWAIVAEAASRAGTNIGGGLATRSVLSLGMADAFSTASSRAALRRQRPTVWRSGPTDLAICPTSWWPLS